MNRNRVLLPLAAALLATLALAGCKKKEAYETPTTSAPPAAATLPAPAPMPSAVATASVTSVDLGKAAGADMKITAPTSSFAAKDKIIAAVATHVGDASATVPAKVAAKWTHVDSSQTVNEEARDVQLKGDQTWDFEITNSNPWPTGKYRVEVMLDGKVVQSRDFEVK